MVWSVQQVVAFQQLRQSMGSEPDQRRRHFDTTNADDEAKLEQVL